ncbi:uncharacterized protein osbpl8 [Gadus macrocephalus]|uniref:uncharacterized protein osbpl8 n=1 Tax=Gadus macrocephalus TaxID=80720 RepID=UPI0028CBA8A3|nr:uncharacterized protein osbpl8 [Gadus macrocephalus]
MESSSESQQEDKPVPHAEVKEHPSSSAAGGGDEGVLLTPGRMSQRQGKEAGHQTPSREVLTTPASLSPGVSYTHGRTPTQPFLCPSGPRPCVWWWGWGGGGGGVLLDEAVMTSTPSWCSSTGDTRQVPPCLSSAYL